ncbi:CPBP family intramembrane glutamic endopeptidase [Streptomonospora litoralis]|uniref:CPBP family intramembrane glutamic endopeptidase n=1 Tax=Streptomonospora litoralis TaxID=2498135 RepID=UPI0010356A05|nr:CPBP family intramembrane glutamic endopeptidase [Streptomonospora litoralis]
MWAWPPAASRTDTQRDGAWAWPPPAQPRRGPEPTGVARPPAGVPYHRLARTRRHRWWMPPLAVVTAVAAILVVQLLMGMAAVVVAVVNGIQGTGDDMFAEPVANLAFQLVVIATMAPIVLGIAWLIQRRPTGTVFSVAGRLRLRWLAYCAVLTLPALICSFAVLFGLTRLTAPETAFVGEFAGGENFALAVGLIVLLVPFQASAEEIALRGFLMQSVGSLGAGPGERRGAGAVSRFLRTPVLAIVISGTVFTLLHDYFGWGLLDVAVFGIAMAWLTWFTGGLEAALGLHVLHNLVAFTISAYEGTLDRVATGGGSWQGVVSTSVEVAVYCAAVVWLARRTGVRRSVAESDGEPDTAGAAAALPEWTAQAEGGRWRQEHPGRWAPDSPADQAPDQWRYPSGDPAHRPDDPGAAAPWAAPGPQRGGQPPPPGRGGAPGPYG